MQSLVWYVSCSACLIATDPSVKPQLLQGWQDDAPHFLIYEDLLDVLLTFVDRQLVEPSLAATALEILFEAQSVQHAEQLFHYLETRMDRLTKVSGTFHDPNESVLGSSPPR